MVIVRGQNFSHRNLIDPGRPHPGAPTGRSLYKAIETVPGCPVYLDLYNSSFPCGCQKTDIVHSVSRRTGACDESILIEKIRVIFRNLNGEFSVFSLDPHPLTIGVILRKDRYMAYANYEQN